LAGWNINDETAGETGASQRETPLSQMPINQDEPGLVAVILKPLLEKRWLAKAMLRAMKEDDPRRELLKGAIDGLKWLGYVFFGYSKARLGVNALLFQQGNRSCNHNPGSGPGISVQAGAFFTTRAAVEK
jgi:hypothetical protein